MNKIQIDLAKLPSHLREWVDYEIALSNKHDVPVHLLKRRHVPMDGINCAGYFCESEPVIMVACHKAAKDWMQVLVHESCHRDQWTEKSKVWAKQVDGDDPLTLFQEWLDGKIELRGEKKKQVLIHSAAVELDCEMRSVEKIKEFELPFDVCEYRKKANAYVYLYLAMGYTRKWYGRGKAPFRLPEVWQQMPNHFDNDYTKLPRKYKDLFLQHCFD